MRARCILHAKANAIIQGRRVKNRLLQLVPVSLLRCSNRFDGGCKGPLQSYSTQIHLEVTVKNMVQHVQLFVFVLELALKI